MLFAPPQGQMLTKTIQSTVQWNPTQYINKINNTNATGYIVSASDYLVNGTTATHPQWVAEETLKLKFLLMPSNNILSLVVSAKQALLLFFTGLGASMLALYSFIGVAFFWSEDALVRYHKGYFTPECCRRKDDAKDSGAIDVEMDEKPGGQEHSPSDEDSLLTHLNPNSSPGKQ